MSQALQVAQPKEVATYTEAQIKLIRDTVAKTATPDEFQLFMHRAKVLGLDPFKPGQIHFVKYSNGPGSVVIGIEGFRAFAHRTNMMSGIERGVKRDEKGKITHGWCRVYRKDWTHPAYEEVSFIEYDTGRNNWAKMPETMIKKVAEAATLRMAFPTELGGVYSEEEMERASESIAISPGSFTPGPDDMVSDDFKFPFANISTALDGKQKNWIGMSLEKIVNTFGREQLEAYAEKIEGVLKGTVKSRIDLAKPGKREALQSLVDSVWSYISDLEAETKAAMRTDYDEENPIF